jgi:hypothetical protein
MASVFGNSYPKIVYDYGGGLSEVTILLPYSVVTRSEPMTEIVEFVSDLDGTRETSDRGTHWIVEIRYLLFKEADPCTKYQALQYYKNKPLTLFMHQDGYPFISAADHGADAKFVLLEIEPFSVTDVTYKDGLNLRFESLNPVWVGYPS